MKMSKDQTNNAETTAVDDVRKVRERIAREHGGDLQKHIEETNRITAQLCAKLNIKTVSLSTADARRFGQGA